MLAPPQRPKRPRSPSPTFEPDLASPLDMILKRRRRDEQHWSSANPTPGDPNRSPFLTSPSGHPSHENDYFTLPHTHGGGGGSDDHPQHGESSAAAQRRAMAGIERRRTKQWERLNAPAQDHAHPATQPTPSPSPYPYPSPIHTRHIHSQPNPQMSSSPIRNHPPSSSPFRDKRASGGAENEWMNMDPEEMRREWGEEYAVQNSLLHSLHLARMAPAPQPHSSTDSSQTVFSTPTLASPHHLPPYRQANEYHYADSSPYNPHLHPQTHLSDGISERMGDDDDMMEVLDDEVEVNDDDDDDVKSRYEETNRLLRELEVVRRRRWGEGEGNEYDH
ncbi:hypothetical protein IAR55_006123 [Kwoniella newhampshirensis]|uniref:Uncharacterized protein n=1 Tax=Kwoniella newhampshirensis TaxID=1651941 RepID=A0AAW0YUT2_9TREE